MPSTTIDQPNAALPDTAVLLLNLGTPDAPTPAAVRRYLRQFLSDRRVIDYPRWLWLPLLALILCIRPRRTAENYRRIWTPQGSPLLVLSRALAAKLGQRCAPARVHVELAMTYGEPSINGVVERLLQDGVKHLLLLPLYPQYSATSTAAAFDAVFAALRAQRRVPEIRSVADYHVLPAYITALAESVRTYWREQGRGEHVLLSFLASAQALRDELGLDETALSVSFQSRVGRERWLGPYTDEKLRQLASSGMRHVQVLSPGFAVDCLETLEEIALRGHEQFVGAGGTRLDYIPALNDSDAHAQLLHELVVRHIQGWDPHAGA